MTTAAKLLARKQQLLQRLQAGPNEREEIERILEQIDTALNQLEEIGPDLPGDQ
jgi:chaperonin cofactor prefoldin